MNSRLAIIDWGIGGISIYKLIREQLGPIPVTYFSDTGVTPYGKMSREELIARLNAVIRYLGSSGVTHLIIGCNAASTALPFLDTQSLKVEGVIEPAVSLVTTLKPSDLGLIGGRRTVVSGVYRRAFAERGVAVKQRLAQPLSALIESGDTSSDTLRAEAKRILAPIRKCSHILLACTHYPAITPLLSEIVSPATKFIDPAAEMVKIVKGWNFSLEGKDDFLTSGDPKAMTASAHNAFGVTIKTAKKIPI